MAFYHLLSFMFWMNISVTKGIMGVSHGGEGNNDRMWCRRRYFHKRFSISPDVKVYSSMSAISCSFDVSLFGILAE